jgi:hypothetical protein
VDGEAAKREACQLIDAWLRGNATSQEVDAWASNKFIDESFELDDQDFWDAIHAMMMLPALEGYETTREQMEETLRALVAGLR